ncbi:MAG: hypothetical protein ACLGIC_13510 [Acidimicrobiia bacterium]
MELTPAAAGDDDFPSDAVLRRPFPKPRLVRADLVAAHAEATDDLALLDRELEALLERRQACLRRIEPLRTRLNRRWTNHHVRRRSRVDEPPVPPAPPGAVALEGIDLREVCTTLLRRHGPQRLRDLHGLLHRYGYTVGGRRPVQRLGDAMAYEERCGRAERLERGVYAATGEGPRQVRRPEPPPGAPLPWEPPVTDPGPPLIDPPVLHDPQHWGADTWPAPADEPVGDGPNAWSDAAPGADDPDAAADTAAPPPTSTAFGDDSLTNRSRGVEEGGPPEGGGRGRGAGRWRRPRGAPPGRDDGVTGGTTARAGRFDPPRRWPRGGRWWRRRR